MKSLLFCCLPSRLCQFHNRSVSITVTSGPNFLQDTQLSITLLTLSFTDKSFVLLSFFGEEKSAPTQVWCQTSRRL